MAAQMNEANNGCGPFDSALAPLGTGPRPAQESLEVVGFQ
jgi:hypothetical protein